MDIKEEETYFEDVTVYFNRLEEAMTKTPAYKAVYKKFARVFYDCLDANTKESKVNFIGPFAKLDYLLKENNAKTKLRWTINDTRVRIRKKDDIAEEELAKSATTDLMNLCNFISFLYKVAVPETLKAQFPDKPFEQEKHKIEVEYFRMIVNNIDDNFIYGVREDVSEQTMVRVCYNYNNKHYPFDWTYLKEMVKQGTQLNIIRPYLGMEGEYYPDLIIVEPDYLVDITSICRCFTETADSPDWYLINKISPNDSTEYTLLGNFSGQLLDEELYGKQGDHTYKDSVMDFFKSNALDLLTTRLNMNFHDEAQKQKKNIDKAVNEDLPRFQKDFTRKNVILEPSFFSEMLGLQGRMDMLQLDQKLLLEQKSGKGKFVMGDNSGVPTMKDEHYMQVLLYMLMLVYNYADVYKKNKGNLQAYLMYSKYNEGLLRVGPSPRTIFEALKMRNSIVNSEFSLTAPDEFKKLDLMTPESLHQKNCPPSFWQHYILPRLTDLLGPLQKATDLERRYYFRFMTFIANEHMLSKIGNKTKECSGFSDKWQCTLEEKQEAGIILDKLQLEKPEGSVEYVTFSFEDDGSHENSNFRKSDIVVLYAYAKGKNPDARHAIILRGSIEDISDDKVEVRLRNAQTDAHIFTYYENHYWAIEHDFMESNVTSLYRDMHAFLSAPQRMKDLILFQRDAEYDEESMLTGEYGEFNDMVLREKQAKDLFMIIGPPGTGKTSFGMLYTLKEELLSHDKPILIMAYTNRAVDEICRKIDEENTLHPEAVIDYLRLGKRSKKNKQEENQHYLQTRIGNCANTTDVRQVIMNTRVFVGTVITLSYNTNLFKLKHFAVAIIDEASQILETNMAGIISAKDSGGEQAIDKFVLIGDEKQLPAVVQQRRNISTVTDLKLQEIGLTDCRASIFERLLKKYRNNPHVTYKMTKQGRMHKDIALFPNYAFYHGDLNYVGEGNCAFQVAVLPKVCDEDNGITKLLKTRRVAFIASRPDEEITAKVNHNEAEIIAALVKQIYQIEQTDFDKHKTVGVIVPYRNQIVAIRSLIEAFNIPSLADITIDTVERYQGSQRKYVIYGFTVQELKQLNFLTDSRIEDEIDKTRTIDRKLNVAITRAQEHLLIVGNPDLLTNDIVYYKYMEFIRSHGGYFDVDKADFLSGNFDVPSTESEVQRIDEENYSLTKNFAVAYSHYVTTPIKNDANTVWPIKILGNSFEQNLEIIECGRTSFSNQLNVFNTVTPEKQVLIYCYYMMRERYCSSANLYNSIAGWMKPIIASFSGRMQMIDFGCGPGTCGISFAEQYLDECPQMVYNGIDASAAMKQMAGNLISSTFDDRLNTRFVKDFSQLGQTYWDAVSELPTLIVFNFSYFFSKVSSEFVRTLAANIINEMQKYTFNKYIFVIQQSVHDSQIASYRLFEEMLKPWINKKSKESSLFACKLNGEEKRLKFMYEVWESKN